VASSLRFSFKSISICIFQHGYREDQHAHKPQAEGSLRIANHFDQRSLLIGLLNMAKRRVLPGDETAMLVAVSAGLSGNDEDDYEW